MERHFGRNLNGRVDFFLNGSPSAAQPADLIALAKRTQFHENGAAEFRYADGDFAVKLTPPDLQNPALPQAVTTGLLLFKLDVSGKSRRRNFDVQPGTYYFFLNFIDDRWVGRAIDARGTLACRTIGILVRQQVDYHPGVTHTEYPTISLHRVFDGRSRRSARAGNAPPKVVRTLRLQEADSGWADVQIGWEPFGAGCWKTIVCVPGPDQ
jgi:hypothetical protein